MKTSLPMYVLFAVLVLISRPVGAQNAPAQPPAQAPTPGQPQALNLADAEKIALANHPQIQAAMAFAAAAQAQKREVSAAYYPTANGSLTGAEAVNTNRIGAGALNDPRIFDKFGTGFSVSQLATDFGRTHELVKSSDLHAKAQQENVVASRADVVLQVDRAYYDVLRTQALLRVAQETVKERQLISDQVSEMAKNLLKSELDVTFANVDLAQAQLLLIQAQNNLQGSFAELTRALGYADQRTYQLSEQPLPGAPPTDVSTLIQQAMSNRPELISQQFETNSAQTFATAERDLWFPTISAVGAAGLIPFHQATTASGLNDEYAAAGFNVNVPIFNGHLYGALRNEATARAQAQTQNLRNLQDQITRDVNRAWLDANSDYQRLSVTQQLLNQATLSLSLAQSRYQLGLSSIVELSQAQLNLTQAQIEQVNSNYDYQTQLSVLSYTIGNVP